MNRANGMRAAIGALLLAGALSGRGEDLDRLRGEQVGWARLKTPSPHWMRHGKSDPILMRFLRDNTTLNLDPDWHVADVENLGEMCRYPLLYSQGVDMLATSRSRANLAEYLRRGGFLVVDACINPSVTSDPRQFLLRHQLLLAEILPEARIAPLPADHEIYRCFYRLPGMPHTEEGGGWPAMGLYGIRLGDRLAGVLSFGGLQCGWDGMKPEPGHNVQCMRMLVNIYIYALLNPE